MSKEIRIEFGNHESMSYIISYHIICKIYSAPITLYMTMGALHTRSS